MTTATKLALAALATNLCFATGLLAQQSTPPPATDYTPAAPGALSDGPTTQSGVAPATSVETSPGIPTSAGQTANSVNSGDVADATLAPARDMPIPAPAPRPTLRGSELDTRSTVESPAIDRNFVQRGELGVWLAENGGPGVAVRRITAGSAADRAGIRTGDILLQINGEDAASPHGVARMIRDIPAGETAVVQFWRNGQTTDVEVVLQPNRIPYQVGFRGDNSLTEMNRAGSDLETRTARLEEQLSVVMRELQQLRGEISRPAATNGSTISDDLRAPSTNTNFSSPDAPKAVVPAAPLDPPSVPVPPASGQSIPATTTGDAIIPPSVVPTTDAPAAEQEDPFLQETSDTTDSETAPASEDAQKENLDTSTDGPAADESQGQNGANATGNSSDDSEDLFE